MQSASAIRFAPGVLDALKPHRARKPPTIRPPSCRPPTVGKCRAKIAALASIRQSRNSLAPSTRAISFASSQAIASPVSLCVEPGKMVCAASPAPPMRHSRSIFLLLFPSSLTICSSKASLALVSLCHRSVT